MSAIGVRWSIVSLGMSCQTALQINHNILKLAGDPALLAELKARLAANLATAPLFDTARTCRNIEAAYSAMWQRQQRGDAPAGFSID